MELAIDDFRLADQRGDTLFSLQKMVIDFDPLTTVKRRTVTFETIVFDRPKLRVVIDKTGRSNVDEILEHLD
jgi:hypothetical protein